MSNGAMKNTERFISQTTEGKKAEKYTTDPNIARALISQNLALQDLEKEVLKATQLKEQQLVIISYVPRSGSTLLSQILASSASFNYISNFQARYWLAPYLGGLIEKSMNVRQTFQSDFTSIYGRTKNVAEPSEFNYFWEFWFDYNHETSSHTLTEQGKEGINLSGMIDQIKGIMTLQNLPLFFKKEWLGMNADVFINNFKDVKVIHVTRDTQDTYRSILKARKDIYNDENVWFGAKPTSFSQIKDLTIQEQITKQIDGIEQDVKAHQDRFPDNFLIVHHESIIKEPHKTIDDIAGFLNKDIALDYCPTSFAIQL